ncbi:Uncharacterized protein PBTT_08481 [Plasmodiophora brassicae]
MIELKEFRFACVNLPETVDFYTNGLLMVMQKKVETGGKVFLSFRYQRSDVWLRFEHIVQAQKKGSAVASAGPEGTVLFRRPVSQCDLLIYVLNIDKTVSRIRSAGFVVFVAPVKVGDEVRACVLIDPNGIRIRLVETVHCLVEAAFEARIGHVSVPVKEFNMLSRTIAFYQQVFGPLTVELEQRTGFRSTHRDDDQPAALKPAAATLQAITKGRGQDSNAAAADRSTLFTIRDSESFTEDMVAMVWLGNAPRSTRTTLCLRHTMDRQGSVDSLTKTFSADAKEERFLGIVFEISDVQRAQNFLETQTAFPVQTTPINALPGLSPWFSFFDPAFINVEIREEFNAASTRVRVGGRMRPRNQ